MRGQASDNISHELSPPIELKSGKDQRSMRGRIVGDARIRFPIPAACHETNCSLPEGFSVDSPGIRHQNVCSMVGSWNAHPTP